MVFRSLGGQGTSARPRISFEPHWKCIAASAAPRSLSSCLRTSRCRPVLGPRNRQRSANNLLCTAGFRMHSLLLFLISLSIFFLAKIQGPPLYAGVWRAGTDRDAV